MLGDFGLGLADLQMSGHAEVDDPLGFISFGTVSFQVENDVFAHAADGGDTGVVQGCGDFCCGGFQRFFFWAEPDGFDAVSGDAFGEAAGDGFDFGEFGHGDCFQEGI